ncbi:MAG TPA: glycosyltransferase family 2 protein [Stellaceae bacterium]|nr:glycosyltransferase family 2 protein [Stellaceae bacterium]
MLGLGVGIAWLLLVLYLLSRALRQSAAYHRAAVPTRVSELLRSVTIVVPVRNEIDNIASCLAGLASQSCLRGRSLLVVDDESEDGTAAFVESYARTEPRLRLVHAGPLPPGWMGKPHACWRGALLGDGDWLCFIDADVRASRDLVASALAAAEADRIDMLSLYPAQELGSFWERVIIPAGLIIIACAKPLPRPGAATLPRDKINGQILLVRRDAYFGVGGHAAVRGEVCEDKALATLIERAGYRYEAMSAEHLARVRMYRDFGSLWEGFAKNAVEIFGSPTATLLAAAAAALVGWTAVLLPVLLGVAVWHDPTLPEMVGLGLAACGSGVAIGISFGATRHFHVPAVFGFTFALGYTMAACLAARSMIGQFKGRVTWKGRTYQLKRNAAPDAP